MGEGESAVLRGAGARLDAALPAGEGGGAEASVSESCPGQAAELAHGQKVLLGKHTDAPRQEEAAGGAGATGSGPHGTNALVCQDSVLESLRYSDAVPYMLRPRP